jgi:hypothetical protein
METLCLQPALELHRAGEVSQPLCLSAELCAQAQRDVWLMEDGNLAAAPFGQTPIGEEDHLLFSLTCIESSLPGQPMQREWLLLRRDRTVQVNGIPVLPVATLEPGSIVAAGRGRWLATSLWKPVPFAAPEAVKNSDCPVCGAPLSLAPVVQCTCGRYMHLEKPDQPGDQQALNCYLLAGSCGVCGRASSLEPTLLPEPDETLVAAEDVQRTLATVGAL